MSKRVSDAALIRALRCISTVQDGEECRDCPYCEEMVEGDHRWDSCAVDKVGLDAADRLEMLTRAVGPCRLTMKRWETLQVYADCKMRVEETAKRLDISGNAIRYRLRIIRQRTGKDPQTRKGLAKLLEEAPDDGED